MQDLVACLQWVKRNVAAFGGDPSRVMIFGQSGGGSKVSHLLAMPSAKGLFHAAAVMSGSRLTAMTREQAAGASANLLKRLDLKPTQIRELQAVPFTTLLAAQADVEAGERSRGEAPRSFAPVMGATIPHHPFDPGAPAESMDVPMIVSNTLDERSYRETRFDMGWDEVRTMLRGRVGGDADKVLATYRDEDPKATPFLVNARAITDGSFRKSAVTMAERKAAAGGAPVWCYYWMHPSPAFGGRYGAVHAVDVPYAMHDIRSPLAGPQAESLRLADEIASAFVAFAGRRDPNNAKTPTWPKFDLARRTTLVFGETTRAVDDPRKAFREMWNRYE
jgi:para-nitrobenzyl esterase